MGRKLSNEIKALLITLFSGVIAASLLVIGMLWHYNPDGRTSLSDVLFSPETLKAIETKNKSGYTFEMVSWNGKPAAFEDYEELFSLIQRDKGLNEVAFTIEEKFEKNPPSVLSIQMRDKNGESNFQLIQFSGDYYRVGLREDSELPFAYFYHPRVETMAQKVFAK